MLKNIGKLALNARLRNLVFLLQVIQRLYRMLTKQDSDHFRASSRGNILVAQDGLGRVKGDESA